jgi:hypothetical protein
MSWTNKQIAFLNEKNAHIAELEGENEKLRETLESIKILSRVPLITDIAESALEVGDE